MVIFKLSGAYATNSLALYSEAGHTAVDMVAALVTLIAVRLASRPPDKDHHFGHSKYESMAALGQLLFLYAAAAWVVYEALHRLAADVPAKVHALPALAIMGVALIVELWRAMAMARVARKSGSEALAASAVHFLSDVLDSVVVIIGLGAAALGYARADSYAALFVAAVILWLSVRLTRDVFFSLTDRAPAGMARRVEELVGAVTDVLSVHDVRIRQAGAQLFTEMHVDLDAALPLNRVHDVLDEIESTLREQFPNMHVVTHPEPFEQPNGAELPAC